MAASSGLLLALAHAPIGVGSLAIVALVPWLVASRRARSSIEAFGLGVLSGSVGAVASAHWLPEALRSLGVDGVRAVLVTGMAALWSQGLPFGAVGWVGWVGGVGRLDWTLRHRRLGPGVLAPAIVLGILDAWMGRSSWGVPLLPLGVTQRSVPGVAQLAAAIGVPGLSAFVLFVNAAIAVLVVEGRRARPLAIGACTAWGMAAVVGLPLAIALRPPSVFRTKTLLVVQPNVPRARRWDPAFQGWILEEIARETTQALSESRARPDAIVWPENALTSGVDEDGPLAGRLQQHVDEWGVPVVTGLVRASRTQGAEGSSPGAYRNTVVWWSPGRGPIAELDKLRAIPWVEAGRSGWIESLGAPLFGDAMRGPRVEEAAFALPVRGEPSLTPVLCFEALFAPLVAARRSPESLAIVNLADDSWVEGETADEQLVAAASFRAIEQRLTLVRVSHGGLSVVIDPFGREIAALAPDRAAHMRVEVGAMAPPTRVERSAIVLVPLLAGWMARSAAEWRGKLSAARGSRGSVSPAAGIQKNWPRD